MVFRCTTTFETREGGTAQSVEEGTVWMASYQPAAMGGYELARIEEVSDGAYTGRQATIRLCRLSEDFEKVPPSEVVYPIGCSTFAR